MPEGDPAPSPRPPPLIPSEWEANLLRRLRQLEKDGFDLVTLSLLGREIISKHRASRERLAAGRTHDS